MGKGTGGRDLEVTRPPRDKLSSGAHGGQPPKVTYEAVCVMLMCVARRRLRVRNTYVRD